MSDDFKTWYPELGIEFDELKKDFPLKAWDLTVPFLTRLRLKKPDILRECEHEFDEGFCYWCGKKQAEYDDESGFDYWRENESA